jgi:hypothetical protein
MIECWVTSHIKMLLWLLQKICRLNLAVLAVLAASTLSSLGMIICNTSAVVELINLPFATMRF